MSSLNSVQGLLFGGSQGNGWPASAGQATTPIVTSSAAISAGSTSSASMGSAASLAPQITTGGSVTVAAAPATSQTIQSQVHSKSADGHESFQVPPLISNNDTSEGPDLPLQTSGTPRQISSVLIATIAINCAVVGFFLLYPAIELAHRRYNRNAVQVDGHPANVKDRAHEWAKQLKAAEALPTRLPSQVATRPRVLAAR